MSACLQEAEPETGNAMDGPNVGDVVLLVNSEERSEYSTVPKFELDLGIVLYDPTPRFSASNCVLASSLVTVRLRSSSQPPPSPPPPSPSTLC